jgi:peptidoglycan/LPS O-acetylase OafA/YrhL
VCVAWLACKWGLYLAYGTNTAYRFFAVTRFDCMMIGAIGAILYFMKSKLFTKFLMNRALGVVCFLLLLFSLPWANVIPAPIRPQLIAILSLVCIASQLENPIINLENRVCDFVGKISYGIYVIHPLLIFVLSALYRNAGIQLPEAAATILIYVIITAATVFVAWLSYKFFESPFLRLKNRFAIVQSQNSMMK